MSTGQGFPASFFILVGAVLLASWIYRFISMRQRREKMERVAAELGLQRWPDDSLPRDLFLHGTSFEGWIRLFNVYEGLRGGRPVAVFDVRQRSGKSSYSNTVIAIRTKEDVFKSIPFKFVKIQMDEWQLLHLAAGFICKSMLIEPDEIGYIFKLIS